MSTPNEKVRYSSFPVEVKLNEFGVQKLKAAGIHDVDWVIIVGYKRLFAPPTFYGNGVYLTSPINVSDNPLAEGITVVFGEYEDVLENRKK